MNNMKTNILDIKGMKFETIHPDNAKRTNFPFISVGNGRLEINAIACNQLKRSKRFNWAEISIGERKDEMCLAIRFYEKQTKDSFMVSKKIVKDKQLNSLYISNKQLLKDVFGSNGIANKMTRYSDVAVDSVNDLILIKI